MTRPLAVVAGYVVRQPVSALTWTYLTWLHGLQELGFHTMYVESPTWRPACFDPSTLEMTDDPSYGMAYLERELHDAGLPTTRYWYHDEGRDHGMSRDEAEAMISDAAVLINVSGTTWLPVFARAGRTILVDTDAPFTQIRLLHEEPAWCDLVDAHDVLATYAVNIASDERHALRAGRTWLPVVPPVHTPSWPVLEPGSVWSTIGEWDADSAAWWDLVEYRQKPPELERIRRLPSRIDHPVLLALGGPYPTAQLERAGFTVEPALPTTVSTNRYRELLVRSRGELAVARHGFVRAQTGAINDRSLVYLASGRPVVASDTGLGWLARDGGLLAYGDVDDAVAAIELVESDRETQQALARQLATRFEASTVVADLLRRADVRLPT